MASDSVRMVAQLGGEVIIYTPHGGLPKTFRVVIKRRPTRVESAGGFQFASNMLEVYVPRDSTDGVMTIQLSKDKMTFAKRIGDAQATEFKVIKILSEDAGMVPSDGGMFRVLVQA